MDLNIAQLRALFEPFDLPHLLRLWTVLALFVFLWGLMIAICGGYKTPKQFWGVSLLLLASVFLLSGVAFLGFAVDPLFLLLAFSALAFIVQGDLAANTRRLPNWSPPWRKARRSPQQTLFDNLEPLKLSSRKRRRWL